jgi:hypothetical protein
VHTRSEDLLALLSVISVANGLPPPPIKFGGAILNGDPRWDACCTADSSGKRVCVQFDEDDFAGKMKDAEAFFRDICTGPAVPGVFFGDDELGYKCKRNDGGDSCNNQITGACCGDDSTCEDLLAEECEALEGTHVFRRKTPQPQYIPSPLLPLSVA